MRLIHETVRFIHTDGDCTERVVTTLRGHTLKKCVSYCEMLNKNRLGVANTVNSADNEFPFKKGERGGKTERKNSSMELEVI